MMKLFKAFAKDEAGAVTVDWVVLTAAIVGLGMLVIVTVGDGITTLATGIAEEVSTTNVGYTGGGGTPPASP